MAPTQAATREVEDGMVILSISIYDYWRKTDRYQRKTHGYRKPLIYLIIFKSISAIKK